MATKTRVIRRCEFCNLFLKSKPDWQEIEDGCDQEYEHGTYGEVIKTGWREIRQFRVCKSCGTENLELADDEY